MGIMRPDDKRARLLRVVFCSMAPSQTREWAYKSTYIGFCWPTMLYSSIGQDVIIVDWSMCSLSVSPSRCRDRALVLRHRNRKWMMA